MCSAARIVWHRRRNDASATTTIDRLASKILAAVRRRDPLARFGRQVVARWHRLTPPGAAGSPAPSAPTPPPPPAARCARVSCARGRRFCVFLDSPGLHHAACFTPAPTRLARG